MHTVKCTQCGRSLTIPKPVVQAKIRCPACGAVFVGTTHPEGQAPPGDSSPSAAAPSTAAKHPAPRPAAPPPPRPERPDAPEAVAPVAAAAPRRPVPRPAAATGTPAVLPKVPSAAPAASRQVAAAPPAQAVPQAELEEPDEELLASVAGGPQAAPAAQAPLPHYVPPKSNKGLYMGLFFGAFALFVAGAAFMLFRYAGTSSVEIKDQFGNVISTGRYTPEQVKKLQEEAAKVKEPNVVQLPPPPSKAGIGTVRRTGGGGAPSLTNAALQGMGDPNEIAEVDALPEDPKVTAMSFEPVLKPGSIDVGTIVGSFSNKYDVPLQDVQITPQVVDPKGRVISTLKSMSVACVPAGGSGRYSAEFDGIPEDQIGKIRISAKASPMAKGTVCYEVADVGKPEVLEKSVSVKGSAQNRGTKPMADCYVWVDFYTRQWIYVRSVRGNLTEDAGRITPGKTARFKAELVLEDSDEAQRIEQATVRVVGKEE